jgi:hypothetical protein
MSEIQSDQSIKKGIANFSLYLFTECVEKGGFF